MSLVPPPDDVTAPALLFTTPADVDGPPPAAAAAVAPPPAAVVAAAPGRTRDSVFLRFSRFLFFSIVACNDKITDAHPFVKRAVLELPL
jgi:hypothetical protein